MDIGQFLLLLLEGFSELDFVEKVDIETEVFVLKGRAILKKNRFLQIYFNELTGTTAYALIENDNRIWGIDYDNMRGWHLHPIENAGNHHSIEKKNIGEVIEMLSEVWSFLQ
ncbi:MAG: hypothetical protein IEMM0007_0285 [bacterium]|nr:MAG: hypothetical protein IEMM0007_0285 [bacterium]